MRIKAGRIVGEFALRTEYMEYQVNRMLNKRICALTMLLMTALLFVALSQARAQTKGALIFQDTFNGPLNHTMWNSFITDGPSGGAPWDMQSGQPKLSSSLGGPGSFNLDYDLPSLVHTGAGLALEARKGSTANGFSWSGSVICTYPDAKYGTHGFTFDDAYVEVRAKMPTDLASGGWPAIWFLPAPGSHGGEIDLIEGGYSKAGVSSANLMATTIHYTQKNISQILYDTGVNLSAGYHTYGVAYKSGEYIKCYFDGKLVRSWTSNVFSGSYYAILCNTIAGPKARGWHTAADASTPSPSEMDVKYVKVWKLK
jgi:hypothetical protein